MFVNAIGYFLWGHLYLGYMQKGWENAISNKLRGDVVSPPRLGSNGVRNDKGRKGKIIYDKR